MATPNLMSVQSMITGVRVLLLDKVRPYRYSDTSLIAALNIALLEGRRLRPDLFICRRGIEVPQFDAVSGEDVGVEAQFRLAFEYMTTGHALLRDQEDVNDTRASTFIEAGVALLVGQHSAAIRGGTPTPAKAKGGSEQPPGGG